jgi:hypothetical protein
VFDGACAFNGGSVPSDMRTRGSQSDGMRQLAECDGLLF